MCCYIDTFVTSDKILSNDGFSTGPTLESLTVFEYHMHMH